MTKIGLILLLGFSQVQVTQDSLGLQDLLQEQQIENQLLEREVELLEEHVKEIRNTVYWALGGVFTLALLFVGVNWFSMNKLYEKDKERLENDIYDHIENTIFDIYDHQINTYYSIAINSYRVKDYSNAFYNLTYCILLLGEVEESNQVSGILELLFKVKEEVKINSETKDSLLSGLGKMRKKFSSHSAQIKQIVDAL